MNKPSSASAGNPAGSKPRALFLAAEAPYPAIGGGAIRAASVLEYLARRFSVHGIFFREPGAPDPAAAIPPGRLDRADNDNGCADGQQAGLDASGTPQDRRRQELCFS